MIASEMGARLYVSLSFVMDENVVFFILSQVNSATIDTTGYNFRTSV